jgi:hypothetical protein
MTYQLLGGAATIVGLIGTWFAARSRRGWLVCIASDRYRHHGVVPGGRPPAGRRTSATPDILAFMILPGRSRGSRRRSWWP